MSSAIRIAGNESCTSATRMMNASTLPPVCLSTYARFDSIQPRITSNTSLRFVSTIAKWALPVIPRSFKAMCSASAPDCFSASTIAGPLVRPECSAVRYIIGMPLTFGIGFGVLFGPSKSDVTCTRVVKRWPGAIDRVSTV